MYLVQRHANNLVSMSTTNMGTDEENTLRILPNNGKRRCIPNGDLEHQFSRLNSILNSKRASANIDVNFYSLLCLST